MLIYDEIVQAVDEFNGDEDEVYKPTFDKKVKRVLIYFAIAAAIAYLIDFGAGNFVVILALFYLICSICSVLIRILSGNLIEIQYLK